MSNRLAEILSKSKAVMQATEENHGSTNMNSGGVVSHQEKEIPNLTENFINSKSSGTKSVAPQNGRYRNLEKSKMPDFIKQAMIDEPIDIPETPNHTFDLDDVPELVQENTQYEERQGVPTQPTTFTSSNEGHTPTDIKSIRDIVREEIGNVVREVVEEYLDKSLVTEDIKIKIGDTIFGGQLKPLPKKRKKRV
tara:strand:- start:991 stop:1572 length:582 start_codon:yes stop_codon:yes gene_type:complete